jgi:L-amino acid N-acyltransferase YncA
MKGMRSLAGQVVTVEFRIRRMTSYDTGQLTEFAGAPGMRCLCYGSDMYRHRTMTEAADAQRVLALVAVTPDERVIGEAGFVTSGADRTTAELTVAVQAAYLHMGVVTHLLKELIAEAVAAGVTRLTAKAVPNTEEPFDEFAGAGLRTVQLLTVGGVTEMVFEL